MKHEQNEILTRVGPNTPMGSLFRNFWFPALLSEELLGPDCPPVRVSLLGERLVAFRDTQRRVGLLDAHCPHRRAELFFGRNEDCGLRCVYHGWKFDVDGRCVDQPSEPAGRDFKDKVRVKAYPVVERAGIVWAYMGSDVEHARLPDFDFALVSSDNRYVSKCLMNCNYQQAVEGSIDTAHLSFLHKSLDLTDEQPDVFGVGRLIKYSNDDSSPEFFVDDTTYGLRIAARRRASDRSYYWRISHWLMPFYALVPTAAGLVCRANLFVPIDDEHCWWYRVRWHSERALTPDEFDDFRTGGTDFAELIPGTYLPKGNCANNYLIDREKQRKLSFTGVRSAQLQDVAIQESQGPIYDRSNEHLGTSDIAIARCRRSLLNAAAAARRGIVPAAVHSPGIYRIAAVAAIADRDTPVGNITGAATLSAVS